MAELRLVAGLGNPGLQYSGTRHNVGFMVIDRLAEKKGVTFSRSAAWGSELGKWGDVLLIKPLTYMNRTGEVIGRFAHYFKVQSEEILVIVHLGETFMRLRVGIGGSSDAEVLTDHVLGEFDRSEKPAIDRAIERAAEAVEHVARNGIVSGMNNYNRI